MREAKFSIYNKIDALDWIEGANVRDRKFQLDKKKCQTSICF